MGRSITWIVILTAVMLFVTESGIPIMQPPPCHCQQQTAPPCAGLIRSAESADQTNSEQGGGDVSEGLLAGVSSAEISGFTEDKPIDVEALSETTSEERWLKVLESRGLPASQLFEYHPLNGTAIASPDWDKFKKHGYRREGHRAQVRNQLYSLNPTDPEVKRLSDGLEELDSRHFKFQGRSMSKLTKRAIQKGGVGITGRGWGITASLTNKWRFYHKYLVRLREARRSHGKPISMCEIGMLAGHSTALLMLIAARDHQPFTMQVFDMLQPGTFWGIVAEGYFREKYPTQFNISWGDSGVTMPTFRNVNPCFKCDFVSLDGNKEILMQDLYQLRAMSHPDSVTVLDDLKSVNVRKGAPHLNSKEAIDKIVRDGEARYPTGHTDRLAYHIARGEIILHECWDPDIDVAVYGNCAISFNMSRPLSIPVTLEATLNSTRPCPVTSD
eukprot:TRINITY_DN6474_c0_g1_i11.p1 TRINITY_DN6474_c0_g1~~TRINITY_DN6474_c0_g1_i11.p1  ORF type:complete len:443 (+),score=55.54 TRINITY_DN6474_c0_g1_i11:85-1413(+)